MAVTERDAKKAAEQKTAQPSWLHKYIVRATFDMIAKDINDPKKRQDEMYGEVVLTPIKKTRRD